CKYGLISAATVVFTYVVSDFGAPKVIGGNLNVLSVDVFKQVVGQQNFGRGAVVGLLLLIPSVVSFLIDSRVRRKLRAQLSARSVPFAPQPHRGFDALMTAYCVVVCGALLAVVGMALWTSFIQLWPYDLSLSLRHYQFALIDGDLAPAYTNSLKLGAYTALFGSLTVFVGAYLIEKTRGLELVRPLIHLLAMLDIARYYFVVAMATLSGVVFLYSPDTVLASVAILHLDEAGTIGPAAALASLTLLTSVAACLLYALATRVLVMKTQAWRG